MKYTPEQMAKAQTAIFTPAISSPGITNSTGGFVLSHSTDTDGIEGENAYQWIDDYAANQRWTVEYAGGGNVYFRSKSGLYLTVDSAAPTNGTNVYATAFTGDETQQFRLHRVPSNANGAEVHPEEGRYVIYTALSDAKCLDISGGAGAQNNGDVLNIWSASNSAAKVFRLVWDERRSSYKIVPEQSNTPRVLDVSGASQVSGTNVHQWTENDGFCQRWIFENAGNGNVYIRSALGTYLDVDGSGTANGTRIHARDFTGAANQTFKLVPYTGK